MDIKTDIQNQITAGFTKEEVFQNLQNSGYTQEEITKEYATAASDKDFQHPKGNVSAANILLGCLLLPSGGSHEPATMAAAPF